MNLISDEHPMGARLCVLAAPLWKETEAELIVTKNRKHHFTTLLKRFRQTGQLDADTT